MTENISTKDKIELSLKAIGLLALVIGGAQLIFEIHNKRQERRLNESSKLISEFKSDIQPITHGLKMQLLPFTGPFGGIENFNDAIIISDSEIQNLFDGIFLNGLGENSRPMLGDLIFTLGYFERVYACVEAKYCDEEYLLTAICQPTLQFALYQNRFIESYKNTFSERKIDDGITSINKKCRSRR